MISALNLLAKQQKDGDSPVKMVVQGSQGKVGSEKMDGLRKCIAVDNHEAVKVGDVEKNMESKEVVKPKFTTDFPDAVVREGADVLTLRADEEGALRTWETKNGSHRLWMRTGWHAICQAINKGVEGAEWETMYYKHAELHQAVKCKKIW